MDFFPLLKSHLKSNLAIDLLETWDAKVMYEYDRIHENLPDEHWASIHSEGVCFKLIDQQILHRIL